MNACKSCKAELVWALSPTGAKSPIEAALSEKGNVLLLRPPALGVLAVTLSKDALALARENDVPLHLNHHSTCPYAERYDKKAR